MTDTEIKVKLDFLTNRIHQLEQKIEHMEDVYERKNAMIQALVKAHINEVLK